MDLYTKLPDGKSLDDYQVFFETDSKKTDSKKKIFVSPDDVHRAYLYDTDGGVFPPRGLADEYCTYMSALRWKESGKNPESAHCGSSTGCTECNNISNNAVYFLLVDLPKDYSVIDGCPCKKCVSSLQV